MGRRIVPATGIMLALALTGCAQSRCRNVTVAAPTSHLLFDAHPGVVHAGDLHYGSQWPSTFSRYQGREEIFFLETLNDVQGRFPFSRDFTLRRFRLRRSGTASR